MFGLNDLMIEKGRVPGSMCLLDPCWYLQQSWVGSILCVGPCCEFMFDLLLGVILALAICPLFKIICLQRSSHLNPWPRNSSGTLKPLCCRSEDGPGWFYISSFQAWSIKSSSSCLGICWPPPVVCAPWLHFLKSGPGWGPRGGTGIKGSGSNFLVSCALPRSSQHPST